MKMTLVTLGAVLFLSSTTFAKAQQPMPENIGYDRHLNKIDNSVAEKKWAEEEKAKRYLGAFELTFYCSCQKCCSIPNNKCANGEYPKEGLTVACDPRVIPLGTYIEIEGFGVRKCMDTGSAIKSRKLDVYVSSHSKALELGRKKNVKVHLAEQE